MARISLLVTGVLHQGTPKDLLVSDSAIAELAPHDPGRAKSLADTDAEIIDAANLVLLPSLIDCHAHLREPGFEYKEDIASGLAAAAKGGFGRVMAMANTKPVNDNASTTEFMLEQAAKAHPSGPFLHPVGALTIELAGKSLAPMAELAQAGCVAVSNDGLPVTDTELFRRAMEYAHTFGLTVIDHAEDPYLFPGAGMNEGATSATLGLRGQPWVAEATQVARDIFLSEYLNIPIHLAHISCIASLDLIRAAKERGAHITAETCPHYLFFTEREVVGYNTLAKVNPPLRTDLDVQAVRQALADGTLDALATDHAPHADFEKEVEYQDAPCGISGLDTALSLAWKLVQAGQLTEAELANSMCHNPATIFSLPHCRFQKGDPADFLLFDPSQSWTVTPQSLASKGKNSICLNTTLPGRVTGHWLGGKRVV